MKKTILALLLAGATWVTGCGSSNDFNPISGQPGNPTPIITPTPTTGYFVDATSGNDATGSFSTGAPFKTLTAAVSAAPVNADITVRPGTYSESISLKNGQKLLGIASGTRPVITGTVVLSDGNTLDFLRFQSVNGNAVDGDDQDGGIITNCEFADTTNFGSGVRARSTTGTWIIEANTMSNLAGAGVELRADTGDNVVAQVNGNTITGNDFNAIGFVASGNSTMRIQANDNIMTGNGTGGTFEVNVGDTADFVAQIVGNTNDDVYRLGRVDLTSFLRIERFGQLTTLNSGGATINEVLEPVTSANNGDAGFGTATP